MKKTILSFASLCFGTMILMGSGCPLIPGIEEKVVELAVGSSLTLQFEAQGSVNNYDETEFFALDDEIDLRQIVEDAGVDINDVSEIGFAGIAYRVTVADPNPNRRIESTTISISRGTGSELQLVKDFEDEAGSTYDFRTLDLRSTTEGGFGGDNVNDAVSLINDMLDDLLLEAKGESPSEPLSGTAHWRGISTPQGESTNFVWEIRLDITIVGSVTLDLPK